MVTPKQIYDINVSSTLEDANKHSSVHISMQPRHHTTLGYKSKQNTAYKM